jgi:hypothetical protein
MIKGLRLGPVAQYFARKPPQSLEKLLQKMDEYIRADNDFHQRREEAQRYTEMTRGFDGRFNPRHVKTIHNPTRTKTKTVTLRANRASASLQKPNNNNHRAVSDHQPQEGKRRKVQLPTKENVLPFLCMRQGTHNKDLPGDNPEAEGNC